MLPLTYPVPVGADPLLWRQQVEQVADQIMLYFQQHLPSNYVATQDGPHYRDMWRAIATALATIQVQSLEVLADQTAETRGEFIYQLLGSILMPAGMPELTSDQSLRDFLAGFAQQLVRGATREAITAAIQLLDPTASVSELSNQTFEVTLEDPFLLDPTQLEANVRVVVDALRPAHTLYQVRHLLREVLSAPAETLTSSLQASYYEDLRSFWTGVESIGSRADLQGFWIHDTLTNLASLPEEARVSIGGQERKVLAVQYFRQDDSTPRRFVLPGGSEGFATIAGDWLTSSVDLSALSYGALLTIAEGPNAGRYRLEALPVGILGEALPACYTVRPTKGWVNLDQPVSVGVLDQSYRVLVDRQGRQTARQALEDVSVWFS